MILSSLEPVQWRLCKPCASGDCSQDGKWYNEPFSPGFVLRIVSGFVPECDDDEGGGHDRGDGGGAWGDSLQGP